MKKKYIQPDVTVRNIALQQMIALSLSDTAADPGKDVLGKEEVEFEIGDFGFDAEDIFGNDTWGGAEEW